MDIHDENSRKTQSYLESIADCMPGNFYWKDKDGRYLGCNQLLINTLGFSNKKELIGKTDYDIWPEKAEKLLKNDKKVIEEIRTLRFKEEVVLNGEKLFFAVVKMPWISSEDRNILGVIGNSLDITEIRNAREQAQAANKAKSAFLANISHDIRTPLSGMISIAEAMIDSPSLRTTENIRDIYQSSVNLLKMLNQILDFTKAESVDFRKLQKSETFPIREVVDDTLSLYKPSAKAKNLLLMAEFANNVPSHIQTKPTFIHKILVNLVGNALKFTYKGYVKIDVWFDRERSKIYFSVSDTGKGIPDDKKESIFEWFEKLTPSYKGTEHGTGLGLATVKSAIDGLEGNIKVKDNNGGGTVFTCEIPVKFIKQPSCDDEHSYTENFVNKDNLRNLDKVNILKKIGTNEMQQPQPLAQDEIICGKHILLIEDNVTAGKGAAMLLKNSGFSVNWVQTGKDGLDEILTNNYDMIISDIGLPDIDGDKVVLKAREEGIKTPIYALTGHAKVDREALIESGFTEAMLKPLNIKLFINLMKHHDYHEVTNKKEIINLSLCDEIGFDRETAKEILISFIENFSVDVDELKQGIIEKNYGKLRDVLHKIQGGAAYACVPKLSTVLKSVHETLKEKSMAGEKIDLDKLFQPVFDSMKELKQEYQQYYL